jgi:hypothetical protein
MESLSTETRGTDLPSVAFAEDIERCERCGTPVNLKTTLLLSHGRVVGCKKCST